jgi:hypothetical protein
VSVLYLFVFCFRGGLSLLQGPPLFPPLLLVLATRRSRDLRRSTRVARLLLRRKVVQREGSGGCGLAYAGNSLRGRGVHVGRRLMGVPNELNLEGGAELRLLFIVGSENGVGALAGARLFLGLLLKGEPV